MGVSTDRRCFLRMVEQATQSDRAQIPMGIPWVGSNIQIDLEFELATLPTVDDEWTIFEWAEYQAGVYYRGIRLFLVPPPPSWRVRLEVRDDINAGAITHPGALVAGTHYFYRGLLAASPAGYAARSNLNGSIWPPLFSLGIPFVISNIGEPYSYLHAAGPGIFAQGVAIDLYQIRFSSETSLITGIEMTGYPFVGLTGDVLNFNFDEGVGRILHDRSPRHANGVIQDGATPEWAWHCVAIPHGSPRQVAVV